MPTSPDNATIAERLEAFAALLDLSGASFYTSRAYRRAAETIRSTQAPIAELVATDRIQEYSFTRAYPFSRNWARR